MKIIGLTGGIASGKTLISDWFEKVHIKVIDADKVYKALIKTDKELYQEIVKTFSLESKEDQSLDFKRLARIVFNDKEKLEALNQIAHPYVIKEMEHLIAYCREKEEDILVLDIPLLYEAKMEIYCDKIICVYLDKETQIDRLMKRGYLEREVAIQRIDAQMSLEEKKERADYVIDNSLSRDYSYNQFKHVLVKIKSEL
ncbi:MAG: dephospho-CoA kinase [Tenericutes bacterium]|jgi:dephospho-CoA kinase|nr:dephospho-CoA kinase [Mycoplasmatota bacterium]